MYELNCAILFKKQKKIVALILKMLCLLRIDDIFTDLHILERAVDGSKKPSNLKLQFLRFITKSFSDELKIGDGGCGQVYKVN